MSLALSKSLCLSTLLSACTFAGGSYAAERVNISVVSGYAPSAAWVHVLVESFIPEVDRILADDGQYVVNWNRGFSGTIAKPAGELDAVQSGLADIGVMSPAFNVDKLPLYNVPFVTPFTSTDLPLMVRTMQELTDTMPAFKENWSAVGLTALAIGGTVDSYQVVCRDNKPDIADFRGAKVAAGGPNLLWIQGTGAVGVSSTLADWYNQLQTGVIDCAIVWAEAANGYKMYEVAPYMIKADLGAAASIALVANTQFLERLPEPVRKAIVQASANYGEALSSYIVDRGQASLESWVAHGGTIIEYTDDQRRAWAQGLPNLAQEWAKQLDSQGNPGSEVLAKYLEKMTGSAPAIRQWGAE